MAIEIAGALLNEIGVILAEDRDYPLDGTFLYAELASQMVGPSVFKDLGDSLIYRWPTDELCDKLLELWDLDPEDRKWSAMQYTIVGGKFDAVFTYPGEFDVTADSMERRERILQRRFGNKRIVYPPLPRG